MKRVSRFVFAFSLVLLLGIAVMLAVPRIAKHRFVGKWRQLFSEVRSPEELQRRLSNEEWSYVLVSRFEDGSWVVTRGESRAAGDSFDVTLLATNSGRVVSSEYQFSGYEGLGEYLARIKAGTASDFAKQFAELYGGVDIGNL